MPDCTVLSDLFPPLRRRRIELSFEGGDINSDAGLLLLQRVDQRLRLTERIAPHLPDDRDPARITHPTLTLLRQRLNWCERHGCHYMPGLAKNARLQQLSRWTMSAAREGWAMAGEKQRCFGHYWYAAVSWKRMRRVIAKAEVTNLGENPRYVATNLDGDSGRLYDDV